MRNKEGCSNKKVGRMTDIHDEIEDEIRKKSKWLHQLFPHILGYDDLVQEGWALIAKVTDKPFAGKELNFYRKALKFMYLNVYKRAIKESKVKKVSLESLDEDNNKIYYKWFHTDNDGGNNASNVFEKIDNRLDFISLSKYLPSHLREIYLLLGEGFSIREIAEAHKKSYGTVRTNIWQIRKILKKYVDGGGNEE